MNIEGIDVSAWQHPDGAAIDWQAVRAAGKRFVWIKATQGTTYTNPYFAEDAIEAAHAGLLVGAYHFAAPGDGTAVEQAQHYRRSMIHLPIWLGHCLDFEILGNLQPCEAGPWAKEWLDNLAELPEPRYLYTLPSWLTPGEVGLPLNAFGAGWYLPDIDLPAGLHPAFLQSLSPGTVEGIKGAVDLDSCTTLRPYNPPTPQAAAPAPAEAPPAPTTAPAAPEAADAPTPPASTPGWVPGEPFSPPTA